jgi:hypothetical protein
MAVAGKSQICGQCGQIVVLRNQVQSSRETQSEMITIEGHAFGLLKYLRQIDRRATDFRGDCGQAPASGKIAGQQNLDAIGQPATRASRSGLVRCAWSQTAEHQCESQALGLQWVDGSVFQAVAQHRDQSLRAMIDAQMLATEPYRRATTQKRFGREL